MMLRIRSFLTRLLGKPYRDAFEHRQYASPNFFLLTRRDDGVKFVPRDLFALESTTSTNKLCVVSVSQPRLTVRFRNRCKFEAASGMHREIPILIVRRNRAAFSLDRPSISRLCASGESFQLKFRNPRNPGIGTLTFAPLEESSSKSFHESSPTVSRTF